MLLQNNKKKNFRFKGYWSIFLMEKIIKYKILITIKDTVHTTFNQSLLEDYGKIILYPDEHPIDPISGGNLEGYTAVQDYTRDGYLDYAYSVVQVFDGNTPKELVAHEIGRASGLTGNAQTLPRGATIMHAWGGDSDGPCFADKKTAKAIYEDSYIHETGSVPYGVQDNGNLIYRLGLKDIFRIKIFRRL